MRDTKRMLQKPLIGLTTTRMLTPLKRPAFAMTEAYIRSITDAGGISLLIPSSLANDELDELLPRLDGILFTGGYDIDPSLYGNPPHPKVERVDADRDRVEIHLVQAVTQSGKPFLGTCRGIQVINVALGGNLYEHLPEQLPGEAHHDNRDLPRNYLAHGVEIQPDSCLNQIIGLKQIQVNSLHHQGVRRLALVLRATAQSPDSLIEAVELPDHPFGLAVQWHPEELQEYEPMRKLFQAFVQACVIKR